MMVGNFREVVKRLSPLNLTSEKRRQIILRDHFLILKSKVQIKRLILSFMTKELVPHFSGVRSPHLTSKIPSKMFSSAFGAQIPQTPCTTSSCETPENLISKMSKQGRDISVFTKTRRVTRGREGRSALPFLENWKKCPNLEKKFPDCGHMWVKLSFKMKFLRVSEQKIRRFFPCKIFLSVLQVNVY